MESNYVQSEEQMGKCKKDELDPLKDWKKYPRFSRFSYPSVIDGKAGDADEVVSDSLEISDELQSLSRSSVDEDGNVVRRHSNKAHIFDLSLNLGKEIKLKTLFACAKMFKRAKSYCWKQGYQMPKERQKNM